MKRVSVTKFRNTLYGKEDEYAEAEDSISKGG